MHADNRSVTTEGDTTITNGIDISNWSLNREGQTLTFSVWDFAGQTVYYNTHQVSNSIHYANLKT
jgi:GTPase SAR1 family protein